jgi:diguanylate cyclase (GGDEF)-like protein/PAS domain S-box-containing protein
MSARILVIDDDPSALLLMRAALARAGFEVVTAAGGDEGLRRFAEQPPAMVMLDVEMPGASGYEVCARMRRSVGEEVPIVMVTGMDDLASIERAYESGATDFIAKPINWALIGHRVRYLLRGRQALLDLRTANARHEAVLQAIPDLLFELDLDGRYVDYHTPRSELLAAPPEQFIGRTLHEVLPAPAAQVCMDALQAAHTHGVCSGREIELDLPQGKRWFELSVARKAEGADGRPRFIALSRDVTERKDAERRIARLAYFDALTGLPNRQSFLDRVDREIHRADGTERRLAVLFMDLDGFKSINDTMGHGAGDLILQWAADRLRQGLRPTDLVSRGGAPAADVELARLGGDEFTALILDIARPEDALAVGHRVLQLMRRPFQLNGRPVLLTASVGIAVYPDDGRDAATLLKHADTAMYHAKDEGRDNCQYYSAALTDMAVQRMELQSSLRQALERGEFHLEYQPQFDSAAGRVFSAEALLRWRHPERGAVPPLEFIALAEDNGLIIPIGKWVLRTACADAARWQQAGMPLRVAVNLSPLQLRDPDLVDSVRAALAETQLAPDLLELEITEGALMEDTDQTMATLGALRQLGVRVALDDFGTGYSSMSYLKRMPLSNLKIDRSFVNGLPADAEDYAIVRAILSLAKSLGFSVTAEGVETREQVRALRNMACDTLQGYYFSRPVPAAEIPALVAAAAVPAAPALQVAAGGRG